MACSLLSVIAILLPTRYREALRFYVSPAIVSKMLYWAGGLGGGRHVASSALDLPIRAFRRKLLFVLSWSGPYNVRLASFTFVCLDVYVCRMLN